MDGRALAILPWAPPGVIFPFPRRNEKEPHHA